MNASRFPLYLSIAIVAFSAQADETVTVRGSVFCFDGFTGMDHELVGARVELMDSDCLGSQICDDTLNTAHVQPDGSFEVTGTGGDPFGGRPDIYIRVALTDDAGVRMTDEIGITRSLSTAEHDHDNVASGTIDFGRLTFGQGVSPNQSTECAVWRAVRNAYVSYVGDFNAPPPAGYIDIQYWSAIFHGTPWTNTDTIHWPIRFGSWLAEHEFGHSIRHAADGNGAHFTNDVVRFRYARDHDPCTKNSSQQAGELLESVIGYNFNEGWANYWEGDVGGCVDGPDFIVMEYDEGVVALALQALQDHLSWTRVEMVGVLRAHPGAIHNLDEFVNHLPGGVASLAGPLIQQARTAGPAASTRPASPIYSRAAEMLAEQQNIERELAEKRRALADMRHTRPIQGRCKGEDCEALFQSLVGPALLQGESEILETELSLLKRAQSSDWFEQAQRELAAGRIDRWLADFRATLAGSVLASRKNALDLADARVRSSRRQLGKSYDDYSRVLEAARAQLDRASGTWEQQPN